MPRKKEGVVERKGGQDWDFCPVHKGINTEVRVDQA